MTIKTIKLLNQINQDFYQKVVLSFSNTRQAPWQGWEKLIKYLLINNIFNPSSTDRQPTIIDLACGNGRFYHFLKENFPDTNFTYLGIDSNQKLLDLAQASIQNTKYPPASARAKQLQAGKTQNNQSLEFRNSNLEFVNLDIISHLLNNKELNFPPANLIVVFGLMHHLPSYDLRLKLIKSLAQKLNQQGILAVSLWRFAEIERLRKKILPFEKIRQLYPQLEIDDLEKNDFFLGWQDQKVARYCHHFNQTEIKTITDQVPLKLVAKYQADGKEGRVNQYIIWQKTS